jgi:hypothetical protein
VPHEFVLGRQLKNSLILAPATNFSPDRFILVFGVGQSTPDDLQNDKIADIEAEWSNTDPDQQIVQSSPECKRIVSVSTPPDPA